MAKNIVTCEFLGRLANNLIQVAACIGYSKKYGVPWAIPPYYRHREIYRQFPHLPVFYGNIRKVQKYDVATDEGFPYKEIPFHSKAVCLRGFFQAWKYFDHAKEDVLSAWKFKQFPELKEFTSLHVRRTDYLIHSDYFGQISIEYIKEAIEHVKPKKIFCFSDDIPWCQQNLPQQFPGIEWRFETKQTEYLSLSQMSSCGNNIIANSSYSWVAAYANRNEDKIVVSPDGSSWFGPRARINANDFVLPEWHQIKFR